MRNEAWRENVSKLINEIVVTAQVNPRGGLIHNLENLLIKEVQNGMKPYVDAVRLAGRDEEHAQLMPAIKALRTIAEDRYCDYQNLARKALRDAGEGS